MTYYKTKIEVYRDGHREVYHRNPSGSVAWTHPDGELCDTCPKAAGQRGVVSGEGPSTGELDARHEGRLPDQQVWDKSSPDGRKEYERLRKARKRRAYRAA